MAPELGQTCPSKLHLRQSVCFDAPGNCFYLNNAKSGCSTIRAALIRRIAKRNGEPLAEPIPAKTVHSDTYWSKNLQSIVPKDTFGFSIVRNPFTRILSAYLDKAVRPGILRNQLYYQLGLAPEATLSFIEFLRALDPTTQLFDQHWRPQVANLLAGRVDIAQIHYLETFSATEDKLTKRLGPGISFVARTNHRTRSSELLDRHMTQEAVEIIRTLYRADFEVFGYDTSPDNTALAPDAPISLPAEAEDFYGCLTLLGEQLTGVAPAEAPEHASTTFAERALLSKKPTGFAEELDMQVKSASPAIRFIALSERVVGAEAKDNPEQLLQDLNDLTRLAPYAIGNFARIVEFHLQQRQWDEARMALDQLRAVTWQEALVERLEKALEAM